MNGLVTAEFFAFHLFTFRLAPLCCSGLVANARSVTDSAAIFVFATVMIITVLKNSVFFTRLIAVRFVCLSFFDANLLARIHLLTFLACGLTYPSLLCTCWTVLFAGGQETILNSATALFALDQAGFVAFTMRFTGRHTRFACFTCL